MRHTRSRRVLAACAATWLLAGACSQKKDGLRLVEKGTLVVCSDPRNPPMEFRGDGPDGLPYTGFDIELLGAIARTRNLKLKVNAVRFDGILARLVAGDCDVVGSSLTITARRQKQVSFSDPYFDADQSLLVRSDSTVTRMSDLGGRTIGVQIRTKGMAYAEAHKPPGATVKAFSDTTGLFSALESDDVAAVVLDLVANADHADRSKAVKIVQTFKTAEKYGFAVERNNQGPLTAIDDGLRKVRQDGTYDRLYRRYFPAPPP